MGREGDNSSRPDDLNAAESSWYEDIGPTENLRRFVRANFWDMIRLDDSQRGDLVELLRGFDFCHLPVVPAMRDIDEAKGLPRFMEWMAKAIVGLQSSSFPLFLPERNLRICQK